MSIFRPRNLMAIAVAMSLSACAADDPHRRAKTGAAIGALAGAVLGHQVNGKSGRYVGAVAGAVTGAAVGGYMDKQQQEFERALAEEQRSNELEIQRMQDDTLKLAISSEVSFDVDSASLKPDFFGTLNKVADLLQRYDRTVIHVVGHTDSTGSDAYNMTLSRRRASSVADYLSQHGVSQNRLVIEGRGESEPRASNDTASGRQQNRRVELYIKPVVEGQEQEAYERPEGQYAE